MCNLQNILTILAGKAEFDDRIVTTAVKHRTRDMPARERCPVLLGASHSWEQPDLTVAPSPAKKLFLPWLVQTQPHADEWPVLVCASAAAKQMAPAAFSSPLLSESSNLCFLLLPNQKCLQSLTGTCLFLRHTMLYYSG